MNILGIGPFELVIIVVIALLVLGPKGMTDLGYKIGRTIKNITQSEMWRELVSTTRDINDIPRKIMDEVDLDNDIREINSVTAISEQHKNPTHSQPTPPKKNTKQTHTWQSQNKR